MASQSGQAGGTPPVKNFTARALAIYNPYFQAVGPEWNREAIFDGTESIGYALEEACAASFNHQDNATCDIFHKQLKLFIDVCREQSPSVVYLYICTHGVRDQAGRLYLMMKDSPDPNSTNLDEFIQSSISGKDLVHYIQQLWQDSAGKVIVLLDCCHAGALLYDWVLTLGPNITGALKNDATRSAVKGGSGLLIFMSCNKDESSEIYYNHTGPLFTKAVATTLLEPPRQKIGVKTLITKVQEKVQWSSSDRQHPTFYCTDKHPEKLGYLGICSTESLGDTPMDISVTGENLGLQSPQNPGVRVVMPRNTKPPESTSTTIHLLPEIALQPKLCVVGSDGAELLYYGCTVSIPAGALEEDTEIEISLIDSNTYFSKLVASSVLKLEPSNLTFKRPVKVTLPLVVRPNPAVPEAEWPELTLMCYAEGKLSKVHTAKYTFENSGSFECTHFSAYFFFPDGSGQTKLVKRLTCLLYKKSRPIQQGTQTVTVAICDDLPDVTKRLEIRLHAKGLRFVDGGQTLCVQHGKEVTVQANFNAAGADAKVEPTSWVLSPIDAWVSSLKKFQTFCVTGNAVGHNGFEIRFDVRSEGSSEVKLSCPSETIDENPEVGLMMPHETESTPTISRMDPGKLQRLARKVIGFWKELGYNLKVDHETIQAIHLERDSITDKAHNMLIAWSAECPAALQRSTLISALRGARKGVLADDLEAGDF